MCNLNVLVKVEREKNRDKYVNFLSCVTANSYNSNSDGDGIYFEGSGLLATNRKKINLLRFRESIRKSGFILSHQRWATHGKKGDIQPFQDDRFVFGHNGIMGEMVYRGRSDSYGFFRKFRKKFNVLKDTAGAIKEMLEGKSIGSYSIFIYDKLKKELFYFKNSLTSIYFYRNKKGDRFYLTTKESNRDFLKMFFGQNFDELIVKDGIIYKIVIRGNRIVIGNAGEFEEKKLPIVSYNMGYGIGGMDNYGIDSYDRNGGGGDDWSDFNKSDEIIDDSPLKLKGDLRLKREFQYEKTLNKLKESYEIVSYNMSACNYCKEITENYSRSLMKNICDSCLILNESIV